MLPPPLLYFGLNNMYTDVSWQHSLPCAMSCHARIRLAKVSVNRPPNLIFVTLELAFAPPYPILSQLSAELHQLAALPALRRNCGRAAHGGQGRYTHMYVPYRAVRAVPQLRQSVSQSLLPLSLYITAQLDSLSSFNVIADTFHQPIPSD